MFWPLTLLLCTRSSCEDSWATEIPEMIILNNVCRETMGNGPVRIAIILSS